MTKNLVIVTRFSLGILLVILAINAFGGGFYGMSGAPDVPVEWIENTPFTSYFIPSLILFVVVGGASLFAGILVFRKSLYARLASFFAGMITIIWISVQVAMIGYVSWMQPTTAAVAAVILVLTWLLPSNRKQNG
jgi:hypothetical protein